MLLQPPIRVDVVESVIDMLQQLIHVVQPGDKPGFVPNVAEARTPIGNELKDAVQISNRREVCT